MAQQTVLKRSSAAAAQNTDTTLFTPAAGVRVKLLGFFVANEGAAQAAGMTFELRFGSNGICAVGLDSSAAVIGQTSKQAVIAHEIIGDGSTAVVARNLVALNTSAIAAYTVVYDSNYLP
jgi:hypothetical protein